MVVLVVFFLIRQSFLDSSLYSIKSSVFFADMTFIHNKEFNFLKLQNIWTYINDLKTRSC